MSEAVVSEAVELQIGALEESLDKVFLQHNAIFILSMQLGFALLEVGSCRRMNSVNICCKNISDLCTGALSFWLFGWALAFGPDSPNGYVGLGHFAEIPEGQHSLWVFNFSFAATWTTIMGGVCVERVRYSRYILLASLGYLVYGPVAHWLWSEHGWLSPSNPDRLGPYGALDYAGGSVVHLSSACASLPILLLTGRRQQTTHADGSRVKVYPSSPAAIVLGTLVLWIGWYAFNGGSSLALSTASSASSSARAVSVTTMGAVGGLISALLHQLWRFRSATFEAPALCNGLLGGLVGITAGAGLFELEVAFFVGVVGGLGAQLAPELFERWGLDDPVNVLGVHGVAGLWGMLSVGLFARGDLIEQSYFRDPGGAEGLVYGGGWALLGTQAVACLSVMGFVLTVFSLLMLVLSRFVGLRADHDSTLVGLDVVEHDCGHVVIAELEEMSQEKQLERQAIVNQFTNFKYALVGNSEQLFYTFSTLSPVGIFHTGPEGRVKYANDRFLALVALDAETVYSDDWMVNIHEEDRAAVRKEWTVRFNLRQQFSMEWRFVHPVTGEETWVLGHAVPIRVGEGVSRAAAAAALAPARGKPAGPGPAAAADAREYFGSLTDITLSKVSETNMRWKEHQQEVVTTLGMHALHGEDVSSLVDEVVPLISETLRVPTCYVTSVGEDSGKISLVSGLGVARALVGMEISAVSDLTSISAHVLRHKDPLTISDLRVDDRFVQSQLPHLQGSNVVSGMGVAIRSKGHLLGTIEALTPERREFSREDTSLLQSFANVLATAIEKERSDFLLHEHAKSDELLFSLFPRCVALGLQDGHSMAEQFPSASLVFVGIEGVAHILQASEPSAFVALLDELYEKLDAVIEATGVVKIEATARGLLVAAGVPDPITEHAARALRFAFAALEAVVGVHDPLGGALRLRIGVATGGVVAGVVGKTPPRYSCFGPPVLEAQQLEAAEGTTMRIHCSRAVRDAAQRSAFFVFDFAPAPAGTDTFFATAQRPLPARRSSLSGAAAPAL